MSIPPRTAFFVFVFSALSFSYQFAEARLAKPHGWKGFSLEDLVLGRAPGVMQRRALVPWMARALSGHVSSLPGRPPYVEALSRLELIFTFLACLACWGLLALVLGSEIGASLAAFSVFGVLPYIYVLPKIAFLPFDVPSLFFFTAGILALRLRKWVVFYPLFAVATLNRETTCFLSMIYALTAAGHEPSRVMARHVAAQAAVWIAVKLWLAQVYDAELFQNHWPDNAVVLVDPTHYPVILSVCGFLLVPVLLLARRIPDEFTRRALAVVLPFSVVMLIAGNVLELRVFGELTPLALAGWWSLVQGALRPADGVAATGAV